MRRENQKEELQVNDYLGLPLHAQGKLIFHHFLACLRRITPACAGKTIRSLPQWWEMVGLPLHAQGKPKRRVASQ